MHPIHIVAFVLSNIWFCQFLNTWQYVLLTSNLGLVEHILWQFPSPMSSGVNSHGHFLLSPMSSGQNHQTHWLYEAFRENAGDNILHFSTDDQGAKEVQKTKAHPMSQECRAVVSTCFASLLDWGGVQKPYDTRFPHPNILYCSMCERKRPSPVGSPVGSCGYVTWTTFA